MSNRGGLPENIFSTDEFLNSDGGDVFVGYGSVNNHRSPPLMDEFFQLPHNDYDADDNVHDPIEIPKPRVSQIVLDGSDSGSDSGISGEHPQSAQIGYTTNQNGMACHRSNSSSPSYLPTYVISKQPTSSGHLTSRRAGVHIVHPVGLNNRVVIASPRALPVAVPEQLVELDPSVFIDGNHAQITVNSTNESEPMSGLVLTANDVLLDSSAVSMSSEDSASKDETLNPKMNSILQSKVKIQPRPNVEAVTSSAAVVSICDSNYAPVTKRARPSSTVKTIVPTMMTGEDTAEIVYTPQTTYVLNNPQDMITLPPSLQVKTEPYLSSPCPIERPTIIKQPLVDTSESSQVSSDIYLYSKSEEMSDYGISDDHYGQQYLSTSDIVERSRLAKKQERMIKNRQAASLSRQRKKEYLETLEGTLDALKRENRELRKSNQEMRRRYDDLTRKMDLLEKQSQNNALFQNSNSSASLVSIASFLSTSSPEPLLSIPTIENSNNAAFTHSLSSSSHPATSTRTVNCLSSVNPIKTSTHLVESVQYPPKLRRKVPTVTTALAASSALAFFCMLVLNFNSATSLSSIFPYSSSNWKHKRGHSHEPKYSTDNNGQFPDPLFGALNFPTQFSKTPSRTLFSVPFKVDSNSESSQRKNRLLQCPVVHFNSTESIRVASELNQWAAQYKKEAKLAFLRNLWYRKTSEKIKRRQHDSSVRRMNMKKRSNGRQNRLDAYAVQIHKSGGDPRMDQLMFGFRRRNDTMYFVSLTGDHLIFPALNTSKSRLSRPKVSFIMPAYFGLNDTVRPGRDQIAMMQIDSEVVNYTVFHIDKQHLSSYFKTNRNGRHSQSWDNF